MKVHYLKTIPKYFWEAARGNKPFEVRKNDRYFKVGDIVRVKVLSVDTGKKRIALTMKGVPQQN